MQQVIDKFYDLFRNIVLSNEDLFIKYNKISFYNFIKSNKLVTKDTDDSTLIKLSIISSHDEWEFLYREKVDNFKLDKFVEPILGEIARYITREGVKFFNTTKFEIKLLRNDVLGYDNLYSRLIKTLNKYKHDYENNPCYNNLANLATVYSYLHRFDDFKIHLNLMKEYFDSDINAVVDYIVYASEMIDEVMMYDDEYSYLLTIEEVEEILALFNEYNDHNRLYGIYSPVTYTDYWIKVIEYYLSRLEDELYTYNDYSPGNGIIPNVLRYEELLSESDKDKYDEYIQLIRLHDDLILKNIPLSIDPSSYSPILMSTQVQLDSLLLNLKFPYKYEYFCNFNLSHCRHFSKNDSLSTRGKLLKERLIEEFPENTIEIIINYAEKLIRHRYYKEALKELEYLEKHLDQLKSSDYYSTYLEIKDEVQAALKRI